MTRTIIILALAGSVGTAWGQTSGKVVPDGSALTIGTAPPAPDCSVTIPRPMEPWLSGSSGGDPTQERATVRFENVAGSMLANIEGRCKIVVEAQPNLANISPEMPAGLKVQQEASPSRRTYTLADIDRMRAAEMRAAPPNVHTWIYDAVIELRVANDIAAGVSLEELERRATK